MRPWIKVLAGVAGWVAAILAAVNCFLKATPGS